MLILDKILNKLFSIKSTIIKNPFLKNKIYSDYFDIFNNSLKNETNTNLEKYYKLRYYEIEKIIRKYDINTVVEMGTGRSTFIFNIIPEMNCVSIEQNMQFLETITRLLNKCSINPIIHFSNVSEYKHGARFDNIPKIKPDLLYIDAPYFKGKRFDTLTGKAAYYCFETFFLRGDFPKVIMIEGRTDTVDEILKSDFSKKYNFAGEFRYCIQRKKYISSLNFARHSIFTIKN